MAQFAAAALARRAFALGALSALVATGCASWPPRGALDAAELARLNQRLADSFTAALASTGPALQLPSAAVDAPAPRQAAPSQVAVVSLAFAPALVPEAPPAGQPPDVEAAHDLFLLSDDIVANHPGASVYRAYRAVLQAARCTEPSSTAPFELATPAGCRLLDGARRLFEATAEQAPPFTRAAFPSWKGVTVTPRAELIADDSWGDTALLVDERYRVTMQTLFLRLERPWLADEFLAAPGWYLVGACAGAVSDGNPGNDGSLREMLPRLPVALLLARRFELRVGDATGFGFGVGAAPPALAWRAPRVLAWIYRVEPRAPLQADPTRADCGSTASPGRASAPDGAKP